MNDDSGQSTVNWQMMGTLATVVFGILTLLVACPPKKSGEGGGVSVTTRQSTPPTGPGDVPRGFLGTWRGVVKQPDALHYKEYPVVMDIYGGRLGEPIGRTQYDRLNCTGRLVLINHSKERIVVEEKVDSLICIDVSINLTLTGSRKISYKTGDGNAFAQLIKDD